MWNEVEQANQNNNSGESVKVEYLKLTPGTTVQVRVLDEQPESRWQHWLPQANHGKGLSVKCNGKGCTVCTEIARMKQAGEKKKYNSTKSHAINVLDRADNTVKILDKGQKIFEQLLNMLRQMGDLRGYDITITTTKTGSENTNVSYNVLPKFPPVPLTEAEKNLTKYDLKELTKGFTNEQIEKLMNGANIEEATKEENQANSETSTTIDFAQGA